MDVEAKGDRARRILEDDIFKEAVDRAKQSIKDDWSRATTQERREALWHRLQAVKAVPEALEVLKTDGAMHRERRQRREND